MQHYPDGLPVPRLYWSVLATALAVAMAVMDGAIANVALPTIARDLHTDPAYSIWIVNGYQLAIVISLLPLSSFGEIVGYRRVYLVGLGLFTIASLACALSNSLLMLAAARVLQGFGAAGVMSVNSALVQYTWPRSQLGRGIGVNALVVAVAAAVGPTVAAGILAIGSWPWLFAINLPLGILAIAIGRASLPHSPHGHRRFDYKSALLSASTFGLLIVALDGFGHGESVWLFLLELVGVAILATALTIRQLSLSSPLLPVDLLKQPIIALSAATSTFSFVAQMLALVSLPFLLQTQMGFTAVETGLLITAWPTGTGIAAPISGRLADRYPAGILGAIGLGVFASGLAALALLPAQPSVMDVIWRMALCGVGFGLFQSPNNRAMIGNAPRERAGGAAGLLGTARLLGQTTGAALVALLFGQVGAGAETTALVLAAGFAVVAAGISVIRQTDLARSTKSAS